VELRRIDDAAEDGHGEWLDLGNLGQGTVELLPRAGDVALL
jgi:hypothetical protein